MCKSASKTENGTEENRTAVVCCRAASGGLETEPKPEPGTETNESQKESQSICRRGAFILGVQSHPGVSDCIIRPRCTSQDDSA